MCEPSRAPRHTGGMDERASSTHETEHDPAGAAASEARMELAGMALRNGVLMLGPTSWAAAVRRTDGAVVVVSDRRPSGGDDLATRTPLLRGPVKLANMVRVLPLVRRRIPEARFGFESRELVLGMLATSALLRGVQRRHGRGPRFELVSGAASLAITLATMQGGEVAAYHGAEHKSIGGYEQGRDAAGVAKEHPRCGTQLALPMLAFSTLATQAALALAPRSPRVARTLGQLTGIVAATELFRATQRGGAGRIGALVARAGIQLQARATTAEPSRDQLDVAAAALEALLEAETRVAPG